VQRNPTEKFRKNYQEIRPFGGVWDAKCREMGFDWCRTLASIRSSKAAWWIQRLIYAFCAFLISAGEFWVFAEVGSYSEHRWSEFPRFKKRQNGLWVMSWAFQGGWLYYLASTGFFSANTVLLTIANIAYFFPIMGEGPFGRFGFRLGIKLWIAQSL